MVNCRDCVHLKPPGGMRCVKKQIMLESLEDRDCKDFYARANKREVRMDAK